MVGREAIQALRAEVARQVPPVLSLYLDVDVASHAHARRAPLVRARQALKDLGVPEPLEREVLTRLELDEVHPAGRSVVIFASLAPSSQVELLWLPVATPATGASGVLARWGRPHLLPLRSLAEARDRVAVVFVDQERWRWFEVEFGAATEVEAGVRPVDTTGWRRFEESAVGAPGVPARGGAGKDAMDRRLSEWSHRFFKAAAAMLADGVAARGVDRIVLMGPPERVQGFAATLPDDVARMVVARLPPPANPDATAAEILPLVTQAIEHAERAEEAQLLDEAGERGVGGLEPVFNALVQGRLRVLIASWRDAHTVYRRADGSVFGSLAAAAACREGRFEPVALHDVLEELADAHGTHLSFVQGDAAERLHESFDGLAGLLRW